MLPSHVFPFFLAVAAFSATDPSVGWDSLARLSRTDVLNVVLKDGTQFQGAIQSVRPDSLVLAAIDKWVVVELRQIAVTELTRGDAPMRRIEGSRPGIERGDAVVMQMRNGQTVQGTVQEIRAGGETIRLVSSDPGRQIARSDIARVMLKRPGHPRLRNAIIGALAGGGVLGGIAAAKSQCPTGASGCTGIPTGAYAVFGGLAGLVGGAVIPVKQWKLIYQAE